MTSEVGRQMVAYERSDNTGLASDGSRYPLTEINPPKLIDAQVSEFTVESTRAVIAGAFDPRTALETSSRAGHDGVLAVDIGGDKLIATLYDVRNGIMTPNRPPLVRKGESGAGYMDAIEEVAALARPKLLPMGVSYAGPVKGSQVLAGVNIPVFMQEFMKQYGGDFANVYRQIVLVNDATAGVMAATVEALRHYPATQNVIYVINGSGLGGAVWKDSTIWAMEAGHVQAKESLNPFGQRKPCGMFGAEYVCLENIGASKAGIEDIWFQQRAEKRTGREIATAYMAGDELAISLYENSAWVTAHVVKGMAQALNLLQAWDKTVVVGHGGTFQVPGYGSRIQGILDGVMPTSAPMIFTKDFSPNSCLDGAAIAGIHGALQEIPPESASQFTQ